MASPAQATGLAGGQDTEAADAKDDAPQPLPPSGPPRPVGDERPEPGSLPDWALLAITAAVCLPIAMLGYGTDLDISDVRSTGQLIRDADYFPSRTPGVPVFETIVALLDPVGHFAINALTAGAAGAAVVGIARIVRRLGHPNGDLVALAFLASPIALVAATSTTDFVWAVAFFVWGVLLHLRDKPVLAGLLFALAIGCRSSTVLLIVSFLVAEGWDRERRGTCLRTLAVMVPLAGLLYVPSFLAFDRTFEFLDHTDGWRGFANNTSRFLYKNYVATGGAFILVALTFVPALWRSLRRWREDRLVRIAALGFFATEMLFLQLPWKLAHLLPALLMLLLWLGATDRNRRPWMILLIVAVALNGIVAFRPFTPDRPDQSASANFEPVFMYGLLLNDVRCRARYMDREPAAIDQPNALDAWFCALEPLRGPTILRPGQSEAELIGQ
jgi:Glycosyltransferase family 87